MVPDALNMDLTLGSAFHVGIYHLLNGVNLEESVGRMLEGYGEWEGYWPLVRRRAFSLEEKEDASYVYYEQAALAEALVRGYSYYALPRLLDTYQVVETEREDVVIFSDHTVPGFQVRWGFRTDGLLLDKQTDALYVLSLKTSKEWSRNTEENNKTDMQGLTEMGAVEQRLKNWHGLALRSGTTPDAPVPQWFWDRFMRGADPVVAGVKMEFAMKGWRGESPKGSGQYKYSNPLIRPYKRAEDLVVRRGAGNRVAGEYALLWDFKDELGGNHTLGKGWRVINIWEDMGVKNWIEYCMENEIQGFPPGFAIERQFVLPVEYARDPNEVQRKIRQIVNQEWRVLQGREEVTEALQHKPEEYIEKLDIHFPQQQDFPHSCSYCSHKVICLGLDSYKFDPMSHPGFVPRTPNHKTEGENGR